MKKIIIPFVLLSAALLLSCNDDNSSDDLKQLPKSITSVNGTVNFTYSPTGQLVKVTDKDSDTEYTETLLTYDSTGKVIKFVTVYNDAGTIETDSYTITYLANSQAKVTDEDNNYIMVTFNENGQALHFNDFGNITNFTYDSKGNIVKIANNNLTTTATYNNDKGILSGITSPKWVLLLTDFETYYFAVNNPVSVNTVYDANGTTNTYSDAYTYPTEHIINGYPTRMLITHNENGETTNDVYTVNY